MWIGLHIFANLLTWRFRWPTFVGVLGGGPRHPKKSPPAPKTILGIRNQTLSPQNQPWASETKLCRHKNNPGHPKPNSVVTKTTLGIQKPKRISPVPETTEGIKKSPSLTVFDAPVYFVREGGVFWVLRDLFGCPRSFLGRGGVFFGCPGLFFWTGGVFFGCPCLLLGPGGCFCGYPELFWDKGCSFWMPKGLVWDGGNAFLIPHGLTHGIWVVCGKFPDGPIGFFVQPPDGPTGNTGNWSSDRVWSRYNCKSVCRTRNTRANATPYTHKYVVYIAQIYSTQHMQYTC